MATHRHLLTPVLAALAALLATAALTFSAAPALAHSELVGSTPADGDVVDVAPAELVLEFNETIQELGTEVVVTGPDGASAADGDLAVDGELVTQPLLDGGAGTYTVVWRAVSADGHPISGELAYEVTAAEETTEETTEAEETAEETTAEDTGAEGSSEPAATTADAADEADDGSSSVLPVVAGIAVLAAVVVAVVLVMRRRQAR